MEGRGHEVTGILLEQEKQAISYLSLAIYAKPGEGAWFETFST